MRTEKKRRQCVHCGREFNKHEHLVRHENSHKGIRPYNCHICDKTFGRRDVLNRHILACQRAEAEAEEDRLLKPIAGPSSGPHVYPVPALTQPPVHAPAQPHFATADLHFPASTNQDSFTADLTALFGDDVLANLPPMHDSAFWTDFDIDYEGQLNPLLGLDIEHSSPVGLDVPGESILDHIAGKWPKLAAPHGESDDKSRTPSVTGWSSTYNELKAGIELKPIEPPSTAFLAAAVHHFFRDFQKDHPFINEANFAPHQHSPLLVLAICASGARFMSSGQATTFSEQVFERMSILLHRNWSQMDDKGPNSQLDFIRAALLLQIYCLSSGVQRLIGQASALQGTIVAHARRNKLLTRGGPVDFSEDVLQNIAEVVKGRIDDGVDELWKAWVEVEEVRRIMAICLHTEAYLHSLIREAAPPCITIVATHIVLPSDESGMAFAAQDALSWAKCISQHQLRTSEKLIDLIRGLYDLSYDIGSPAPLSVYALRFQLDAMYQHERCRRLSILPASDGSMVSDAHSIVANERWRRHYLSKAIAFESEDSRWRQLELTMTWHAHCLSHLIDLASLELAHGKEGQTASLKPRAQLNDLQGTPTLHRALLHAGAALGALAQVPRNTSGGLPLFTICFKAALLLSTFATTDGSGLSLSDPMDWDRVGLAGIDGFSTRPDFAADPALSPAERFIWSGGAWSVNDMHTSVEILRWTADALTTLGGSAKPIGAALGSILRMRADAWS